MKFLSLLITTLIFAGGLNAQINPKTKWGDVSQAEIDYKQVPFEKDAGAVILYEEGGILISDIISEKKVYKRIKILNQSGIEWANQELIYYSHEGKTRISGIKAQTINFENGEKTISSVDKKSIFEVKINDYYDSYKFTFPNVQVGSILELEYYITEKNFFYLEAWKFQHQIPTLYSAFSFSNNSFIDFRSILIGDKIVRSSRGKTNPTSWIIHDIPSFNKIQHVYNPEDASEQVIFQIQGYIANSYRMKENSEYIETIGSWMKLNEQKEKELNFLQNPNLVKELSIKSDKNPIQHLKNILNYFKSNFTPDGYTTISPKKNNRQVIDSKIGNVAELNLLLNTILEENGFDTKLLMISTRKHGKLITSYPYLGQFNALINLVTLKDGSTFFIDASGLQYELGFPPLENNNHLALILDREKEQFINVMPQVSEYYSNQNFAMVDGKFMLTKTNKYNGYFNEKTVNSIDEIANGINIDFSEKSKSASTLIENKYLGQKTVFQSESESQSFYTIQNPLNKIISNYKFDEQFRERALEFNFPFYYKILVSLKVPDNYIVEIPQNFNIKHEAVNQELIYFQKAEIKEGILIYTIEFLIKNSIFDEQFVEVKKFFERINLDANKSILLKKQ